MVTLARAMQAAHQAGIVHRDLKPSNVLFTGTALPRSPTSAWPSGSTDSRQTETGQIMGTPSYMAPEQARGHTRDVGPAADVYALGAILYEMLTGRPPFKGETPMETVRQVIEDEVVPPSRLVPRVARDLETICLHCLKKEPAKRYGTARALAEDLENFLAGRPIKARPTPFWERGSQAGPPPPRRRDPLHAGPGGRRRRRWLPAAGQLLRQQRELQENLRIAELNGNVLRTLLQSQEFLSQGKWSDAEIALTRVQAEIRDEPVASDLARRTSELLEQAGPGTERPGGQEPRPGTAPNVSRPPSRRPLPGDPLSLAGPALRTGQGPRRGAACARGLRRAGLGRIVGPGTACRRASLPLKETTSSEGCYELLLVLAETEEPGSRPAGAGRGGEAEAGKPRLPHAAG